MSLEQTGLSFTEKHEEPTLLGRFERLLEQMKRYAEGETGWQTLPQRRVTISRGERGDTYLTHFFIFLPSPSPEYSSSYSPSILMELGSRVPEPETGKLIGEAEQTFVRKDYLEESSSYYDKFHEQAAAHLEKIEGMFYAYENTKESLKPT